VRHDAPPIRRDAHANRRDAGAARVVLASHPPRSCTIERLPSSVLARDPAENRRTAYTGVPMAPQLAFVVLFGLSSAFRQPDDGDRCDVVTRRFHAPVRVE